MGRIELIEKCLQRQLKEDEMGLIADPEFKKRFKAVQTFIPLNEKDNQIVYDYFVKEKPSKSIADDFTLTPTRINQIVAKYTRIIIHNYYTRSIMLNGVDAIIIHKLDKEIEELEKQIYEKKKELKELIGDIEQIEDALSLSLDECCLSTRTRNVLNENHIYSIGELITLSRKDLMQLKNLGEKSYIEIITRVYQLGLKFKED